MTRFRRSTPDERRAPSVEDVASQTGEPLGYDELTTSGKLKWKPWPDLAVAAGGFIVLIAWLGWVVWMLIW